MEQWFPRLDKGGPQRWVSYDLYGVERGERAPVFGIHVIRAVPLPIYSSQCKLSFPVRSNSSALGHLVSEGIDWNSRSRESLLCTPTALDS